MLIAYVSHYLTNKGLQFFEDQWFPSLLLIINQQPGFISLSYKQNENENDRIDILLKFTDKAMLEKWADLPIHDEFIKELDLYRSRDYWEVAITEDEKADPASLEIVNVKVENVNVE